ncbi:MAG: hypothetical protein HUJ72_00795, partial [Blautia sp.]|nr:hypothetical protein [Blautia sp.]
MKPKVSFLTRIASLLLHLSILVILFYFGTLLYKGLTIVSEDSAAALQYFIDLLDTELFMLAGYAVTAWLFA